MVTVVGIALCCRGAECSHGEAEDTGRRLQRFQEEMGDIGESGLMGDPLMVALFWVAFFAFDDPLAAAGGG